MCSILQFPRFTVATGLHMDGQVLPGERVPIVPPEVPIAVFIPHGILKQGAAPADIARVSPSAAPSRPGGGLAATQGGGVVADRVLVVEDEPSLRYVLSTVLGGMGCDVTCAASAEAALGLLDGDPFALALVDIVMPGMNGIELLGILRRRYPDTEVIIMTSHASVETVIDALRQGAYDYLHKPFELDEVSATTGRALEKRRLVERNRELLETTERQNRELAAAVRRLAALNAASIGFSSRLSVQEVLDLFLGTVRDTFDAERVSIMMRDADEDRLRIVAAHGLDPGIVEGACVRRGEGVAGLVFERGESMLVEDAETDAQMRAGACADPSSSFLSAPNLLSVPIRSLDRVIGVVNVTNRRSGAGFRQDDAEFLMGLCSQVAVSLERARQTDRLHETVRILKSAQDRLVASERLNALGEMAAGVAHDFNNILNGILGRAQLLRAALAGGDAPSADHARSLDMIETLARQGADAVKRIQESAGTRRERPSDLVDVNGVVRLGLELLRPRLDGADRAGQAPIDVRCELDELPLISGSALDLLQALSNVVFNAVDAMPDGGVLTFRTGRDGARVRLEVTDTGVGMSNEVKARLFQPFHTTKPQGNGLGLSIVHGLVSGMGGSVEVASAPGRGTTLTILLPIGLPGVCPPAADVRASREAPRPARVLVVDDERYNLDFYSDCLALHGHEVESAACGDEALAMFARRRPELVITDLTMPGMTGWELAAALKSRDPGLPVILLSGWGVPPEDAREGRVEVDLMLSKPIDVEDLLEAVQQTLRAASIDECA
jgi:CheY-like chemotaxis protein/GAF domain-containing protein